MTTTRRTARPDVPARRASRAELLTRVVVVLGLTVDAVVHLRMAPAMDIAAPGGVGGGNLFRVQGAVAGVVALVLLLTGRRRSYVLALLVALSALVPVLLYHVVDVPAFGPIPSMYDPLWSPEKVLSIVGEALAAGFAVRGVRLTRPRPDPSA